jgi:hypothetical protein
MRNAYKILIGKPEEKSTVLREKCGSFGLKCSGFA